MSVFRRLLAAAFLVFSLSAHAQPAAVTIRKLVVLISIDGLKPEAILDASAHGLNVPNLRKMMQDGVYSTGVTGVLPTLTYPSHTTIMTGVSPAKHGIYSNTTFDPLNTNQVGWYWYTEDIKVPTLWDAAHAAHLTTANVYWPVSVGTNAMHAPIDYNLAQLWRAGTADDLKLQRSVSTPGLIAELETRAAVPGTPDVAAMDIAPGHYPGSEDETVADDETRAKYAVSLLTLKHPNFMTVYFTGLDTEQHKSGPFSPAANAVLERIDALVGQVRAAADRETPGRATVCVVSDHGFAKVEKDVNLYSEMLKNELLTVNEAGQIDSWSATLWPMGGSAAVMLEDESDTAVRTKVDALLARLAADPANGVERILTHDQIVAAGGLSSAESLISMAPGYEMGYLFVDPLITPGVSGGMHGYTPDHPEMRSSFFLVGPGVAHGKSLIGIDMRNIAPTIAQLLGTSLPAAEMPALNLK